jgi:hypothetical protein
MFSAAKSLKSLRSIDWQKEVGILPIRKHTISTLSTTVRNVKMTKQAKTLNERELQRLLDFAKTNKKCGP